MKKLNIVLIILLGLLAFAPQIAKADLLRRPSGGGAISVETETDKAIKQAQLLMCLYNKKITVPQKYNGPALKSERTGVIQGEIISGFMYFTGYKRKAGGYAYYNGTDCFEHIAVGINAIYDVTDIPPGSYLKENETGGYEVFSPKDNAYKSFIWNKMRNLEKKMQEAKESALSSDKKEINNKLKNLQAEIISTYKATDIPTSISYKEFMKFFFTDGKTEKSKTAAQTAVGPKTKVKSELENFDYLDEKINSTEKDNYETMRDFAMLGMLYALLLTIVIEGIIAAPFGWKFIGLVTLANIITNPAINAVVLHYHITSTPTILLLEAAVVLIEWGIFSVFIRKNYGKLLLFSLVANAVSYLSGFFLPI